MKAYIFLLMMVFPGIPLDRQIVINEVMASNHTSLLDEDGGAASWIELHNPGVNLPILQAAA